MSAISPGSNGAYDVELRAVTKRFGSLTAVDAVNLKVRKGEFLSLLGPVPADPGDGGLRLQQAVGGRPRRLPRVQHLLDSARPGREHHRLERIHLLLVQR